MLRLSLIKTPNPRLFHTAKPVKQVNTKIKQIVQEMKRVLLACQNPVGVGLAAPQVGLAWQIFLIKPTNKDPVRCFINPKITNQSKQKNPNKKTLEGCLSIDNVWANVQRNQWIELEYLDLQGKLHQKKFSDWEALIIQHEIDHLQGVLFTQKALEQKKQLYRIIKSKGKEKLEPIEV